MRIQKNKIASEQNTIFPQNIKISLYIIHYYCLNHEKMVLKWTQHLKKTNLTDLICHVYNPNTSDFSKDSPVK